MSVTIKDVASRAGLSIATVSKAFNDYSDISDETKTLVRRIASEIGYYPNATARTLKTNRSYNLGLLFDEQASSGITHPFFAEVINAFKSQAEALGYDITFINRNVGKTSMSFLDHCRYRNVDGVCLAGVDFFSDEVHDLIYSDIPCVCIDHVFDGRPSVLSENVQGVQTLVEYGISLGHSRIAFIHGENTSSVTRHRITGFYRGLSANSLTVPDAYLVEGRYINTELCRAMVLQLLDLPVPPTLILLPDDFSYLGALDAAGSRHLQIGRDISFAGYDGIRLIQHLTPQLTTIRQDTSRMGAEAARQLIACIEKPSIAGSESISVSGSLLKGSTVADLR